MKMMKRMNEYTGKVILSADGTDVPIKIKIEKAGLQPAYRGDGIVVKVTAILPGGQESPDLSYALMAGTRLTFFGDCLSREWGHQNFNISKKYERYIVKKFVATTYTAALEAAEEYVNKEIEELTNFFNNRAALLKAADE